MSSPAPARSDAYSVLYGQEIIFFSLKFSNRKTLAVSVNPDLSVSVTAPTGTAIDLIKAKVHKRAAWILKQQDYFTGFLPPHPPRQYVSGETHYYLGRQYRLKVEEAEVESVKMRGGYLYVWVKQKDDPHRIEALLNEWLLAHAKERFQLSLERCGEKLRRYGIKRPQLRIRKMIKRWGSCTRRGIIYLNPDLIKTSSHCIDYVVTHELCHLKQPHHGKEFYALLSHVMPDWEQRKQKLERVKF